MNMENTRCRIPSNLAVVACLVTHTGPTSAQIRGGIVEAAGTGQGSAQIS